MTKHGYMTMAEVYAGQAKAMMNHAGQRVVVWPLFWMAGEPTYPQVDLPPGEERRTREMAANAAYEAYRSARRREGR